MAWTMTRAQDVSLSRAFLSTAPGHHAADQGEGDPRSRGTRCEWGTVSKATVHVKNHQLQVYLPIGKQQVYPPLMLTVIYAQEASTPRGREKIDWKLITNLAVRSRKDAVGETDLVRHALANRNVS
jgi:hypothetical protein